MISTRARGLLTLTAVVQCVLTVLSGIAYAQTPDESATTDADAEETRRQAMLRTSSKSRSSQRPQRRRTRRTRP